LASKNGVFQTAYATNHDNNYGLALALAAGGASIVIAALILFGPERRGVDMTESAKAVVAS